MWEYFVYDIDLQIDGSSQQMYLGDHFAVIFSNCRMAGELNLREASVRQYERSDNQCSIFDIHAGITRANHVPRCYRDDGQGGHLLVAEANVGNLQFNSYFSL